MILRIFYLSTFALLIVGFICSNQLCAESMDGNNFSINKQIINAGGGEMSATDSYLVFSIGQAVMPGTSGGNQYYLHSGFLLSNLEPEAQAYGAALDMNIATYSYNQTSLSDQDIEPTVTASLNDEIFLTVVAQNVTNLDTYQVEVLFDPAKLQFLAGYEENTLTGLNNILKSNGGTTIGFMSVETTTGTVNIVNSLVGDDASIAPEGTGIIAILKFRVLAESYSNNLLLNNVYFVDNTGINENAANLLNGAVLPISTDSDNDGIDDGWELLYFDDLVTANAITDFDNDGYSDRQEYLNWVNG
ncbi:MAG: cohesin domain-containing protein, partial [Desulfobulbaceae bacterium]|nr:cohesin domain-containing protein [Desulfobulbaceae bacterium]